MEGNTSEEGTVQQLRSFQFCLAFEVSLRSFAIKVIKVGESSLGFQDMLYRVVERGFDNGEPQVRCPALSDTDGTIVWADLKGMRDERRRIEFG